MLLPHKRTILPSKGAICRKMDRQVMCARWSSWQKSHIDICVCNKFRAEESFALLQLFDRLGGGIISEHFQRVKAVLFSYNCLPYIHSTFYLHKRLHFLRGLAISPEFQVSVRNPFIRCIPPLQHEFFPREHGYALSN